MIDIAMTAVLRPKLLNRTLESIVQNVVDDINRFRLIINIDPIGENVEPKRIVKVAKHYFKNVTFNISAEPSFPKAVIWIWRQVETPFFFHWEDDVKILRKIDVNDMIRILEKYEHLSSLRLYRAITPNTKTFFTFSCKWRYNEDGFYQAADWKKQFGLNPILIKKAFIDQALPRMITTVNPEKQFRYSQEYMRPVIKEWHYGLYTNPGEERMVDGRLGHQWKNNHGLTKPQGSTFLNWVKKETK